MPAPLSPPFRLLVHASAPVVFSTAEHLNISVQGDVDTSLKLAI